MAVDYLPRESGAHRAALRVVARAANGQGFKDPKNNHFEIIPAPDIVEDPNLIEMAKRSKEYLNKVIEEHPNTPWALLARKELEEWLGWDWREWFVDLTPPPRRDVDRRDGRGGGRGGGGGSAPMPSDSGRSSGPPQSPPDEFEDDIPF